LAFFRDLSINLRIQIAREGEEEYYISALQDIKEKEISIAIPYRAGIPLALRAGDRVVVNFAGENEAFRFSTTVLGRRSDRIPLYSLAFPETIERVQRREHVRAPVMLEAGIAEVIPGKEWNFEQARSLDISAGGMKIFSPKPYPVNTILMVRFTLPKKGNAARMTVKAKVVRQDAVLTDGRRSYLLGVRFVDITSRQQDEIFSFIFSKMTELGRLRVKDK